MSERRQEAFELYKELVRAAYAASHVQVVSEPEPFSWNQNGPTIAARAAKMIEFDALAAVAFDAADAFESVSSTDGLGGSEDEQPHGPECRCSECASAPISPDDLAKAVMFAGPLIGGVLAGFKARRDRERKRAPEQHDSEFDGEKESEPDALCSHCGHAWSSHLAFQSDETKEWRRTCRSPMCLCSLIGPGCAP